MTSAAARVDRRGSVVAAATLVALLALLSLSTLAGRGELYVALLAVIVTVVVTQPWVFRWPSLAGLIIVTIFFIPIRRYELPASLPIVLEPYRVAVAAVIALWFTSLLTDRRVQVRRSGLEGPLVAIGAIVLLSDAVNPHRFESVNAHATKAVMFLASFVLVFYFVVGIARRRDVVDALIKTMVCCGSVVAVFSLIEFRTGYNVFDHLSVIPGLRLTMLPQQFGDITGFSRGGRLRVYASAQHPIALGAALTMLAPCAFYIAQKTRQLRWWLMGGLCVVGMMATVSRVGIVMIGVIVGVFLWLRPRETRRLWPIVIPLVLMIHIAAPGTLGTLKDAFMPKGGLIAQEDKNHVGSGRLATLGPVLHTEVYPHILVGEGYGTRVIATDAENIKNAPITDDQWLGTLAETGILGAAAWIWLYTRIIRRLARAAKDDRESPESWLYVCLAASISSFAVGMFLFDAFSFIQVTFVLWFMLALGCAALTTRKERSRLTVPTRVSPARSHA